MHVKCFIVYVFFETLENMFFLLGGQVQGDQSFPFRLLATGETRETEVLG